MNVIGIAIPLFIFWRVNFHDHFIRNGQVRCAGTANKHVMDEGERLAKRWN